MAKGDAQPFEAYTKKGGGYVRIFRDMLRSDAFKSLTHAERTVYLLLKAEYTGNGNEIKCTYRQMSVYGMNTATISKALKGLEQKGFIEIDRGALQTGNLHREPTVYRFSSKWRDFKP